MFNIAFYSNDSDYQNRFSLELSQQLRASSLASFRIHKVSATQTSLFTDREHFDLCIVDITDSPGIGLQTAASLSPKSDVMIIAADDKWAMEAYDADAIGYFIAPADINRMARLILRRFLRDRGDTGPSFSFRTQNGSVVLPEHRIVYIECFDHRMLVHTDSGEALLSTTMRCSFAQAVSGLLESPSFIRTHSSFVINIRHISHFSSISATMDTGDVIPVSHGRGKEVREKFKRFFQKGD